jgi:quercetin dioxygenase-like cupin family protein
VEIRRFGPGHRRPEGPPGTTNVSGQVIMHDERAVVSELAFGRYAMVTPHANPTNTALFVVISGAGFVQVGDERVRVNHGEAVVWPAGELHGAYTDGTEMRAIVVELTGDGGSHLIEGTAGQVSPDTTDRTADVSASRPPTTGEPSPARGSLADRTPKRDEYDSSEGEPW